MEPPSAPQSSSLPCACRGKHEIVKIVESPADHPSGRRIYWHCTTCGHDYTTLAWASAQD